MSIHLLAAAVLLFIASQDAHAQEICTNGIDDDADGLVDLNDTVDCPCDPVFLEADSLLPNPSFEEFDCIPSSFSQMGCSVAWESGTYSTADYFRVNSYFPAFIPLPLPGGGMACVGGYMCPNYMEYPAVCVQQPLLAGNTYTLTMSIAAVLVDNFLNNTTTLDLSEVNVTLYGLHGCTNWPAAVSLCPGNEGWIELGHVAYNPINAWSEVSITFVPPTDILGIMIGSPCDLPPDFPPVTASFLAYFLYDDFSLSASGVGGSLITQSGALCTEDMVLDGAAPGPETTFQWYTEGMAIDGQVDSLLLVSALGLGSGIYQFASYSDSTCAVFSVVVAPSVYPEPYIEELSGVLICTISGIYQWFLDGEPIAGAIAASYEPTENGLYTVQVTNAEGCSELSGPYALINVGLMDAGGNALAVSCVPGSGTVEILGASVPFRFVLYNTSGQLVAATMGATGRWSYDLSSYPTGMYLALINGHAVRVVR